MTSRSKSWLSHPDPSKLIVSQRAEGLLGVKFGRAGKTRSYADFLERLGVQVWEGPAYKRGHIHMADQDELMAKSADREAFELALTPCRDNRTAEYLRSINPHIGASTAAALERIEQRLSKIEAILEAFK